jgi:hypothetical protein
MRRKFLYAGACLLVIGLACLIVGEAVFNKASYVEVSGRTELSWELSGNLTSGKTYLLIIESGDKWGEPFRKGDIDYPVAVNITITSPDNSSTRLQAYFYGTQPASSYYQEVNLAIVSVDYLSVDEDSLIVTEPSSQIRFTVKREGFYDVSILPQGLAETAPNWMAFYEEVNSDRNAYLNLVSSGGSMFVVGVLISVWSVTRKERINRKKRN